ncbi:MAG: Omp28 family outer membrane lipoprotein [Burkholderiales bacterium]|nr:Omp28 family outer membrane lipoprotein [Bacteroidia bacterium]
MKKTFSQIIILLFIIGMIVSCDFVQDANPPLEPTTSAGPATNTYISDSTTNSDPTLRKALVEDYTGHKCGNCPTAADVLKSLEVQYPGKIVPLAIHAGFFANINTTTYPTDFRNTAGNTYDTKFGISTAGNPNGLVNRVGYGSGGFIKAYSTWGGEVSTQISQVPKFQLLIKYKYDVGSLKLDADVKIKSLANNSGSYKVVLLLTEDSIIAEQLDYRLPSGSQLISNYEFSHVLRGAINSEWGSSAFTAGAALNGAETVSISNYQINTSYKRAKCHILAYIYDSDPASPTYYEVLQVEELKLK